MLCVHNLGMNMYMCIYICVYTRGLAHTIQYVQILCAYNLYKYTYAYMHIRMSYTHIHAHKNTQKHIHTYIYSCVCVYIYIQVYMYTSAHLHIVRASHCTSIAVTFRSPLYLTRQESSWREECVYKKVTGALTHESDFSGSMDASPVDPEKSPFST